MTTDRTTLSALKDRVADIELTGSTEFAGVAYLALSTIVTEYVRQQRGRIDPGVPGMQRITIDEVRRYFRTAREAATSSRSTK